MNIDKDTNKNNDKVLIQFYDDEKHQVIIHHLGSMIQNVAMAIEILKSVESVLKEYDIV
ncbi:hypothetical protein DPMN_014018 [Dreissena polymorpha]|uniref:Uncharacterized protein n=1 Tax=Dreissena polymorpha TaxID=45954 RepID=A0A9D4S329_DREPO|nr:hypothetical protein DPMN_014018 [Dreissena polymorpha]